MIYDILKILHMVAVFTFISGLVALCVAMLMPGTQGLTVIRSFDRRVTGGALGLTWILGLTLAYLSGYWATGWFGVKLLLVIVVSGLHGALSGRLRRRLEAGGTDPFPAAVPFLVVTLVCVLGIVSMLVLRPF